MDIPLRNALDGLRKAGATGLPDELLIEQAPDGSRWQGNKKNGDHWFLIKHKSGSYNAQF